VTLALATLLGAASGTLADRTGARPLVLLGGLLAGGGLLLASRADTLWHLYVTYELGLGLGIGFVLVPATETVQHWFVRRRGFASGLAVAGIGAGNLAFPPLAAALLGMIGGGSLAGRFLVGGAADRFGRRRSLLAAFGVAALFLAWWLLATEPWSLAIFAAGFGLAYGSLAALYPALAADYFGTKHAGAIIGIFYTSLAPGSLLGPTLAGYAYDLYDSYALPILASVVTMVGAAICVLFLPDPQPSIRAAAPAAGVGVAGSGGPFGGAHGR
jgi:MFS family permease